MFVSVTALANVMWSACGPKVTRLDKNTAVFCGPDVAQMPLHSYTYGGPEAELSHREPTITADMDHFWSKH